MESEILLVSVEEHGARLDQLLAKRIVGHSRQYFQYLICEGFVSVNGKIQKKGSKVVRGDKIIVELAATAEISLTPESIPLDILYEDNDIIAINKHAGMVVHPAVGNWSKTFVNALLFHCKDLELTDQIRPGIVHRLDKETSGVLLAAKNEKSRRALVAAFTSRQIEKEYIAICVGNPGNRMIETRIGRSDKNRKKMAVTVEKGKTARTRTETLFHDGALSLVRLFPETGRTHQLRVHLHFIGCPVLGDSLYGSLTLNKKFGASRQLLHAYRLCFTHPTSKEQIELKAPLPQDIKQFISIFS